MISAHRIEYRGYSSIDFDLITCLAFESDNSEVNTFLTREAVASESYRGEFKRIHNFKYTETFAPKFTFIKEGYRDFTTDDVRKVLRWLTSGANASFLTVYQDDGNVVHFEVLGGFSEVSLYKMGNGRVVAVTAVFESSTPYALSPLHIEPNTFDPTNIDITKMKDVSAPTNNTFTITIDTDEPESAVYPKITIKHNNTNYVRIADDTELTADSPMIAGTVYYNGTTYYWLDSTSTFCSNTTNPNLQTTGVKITNTYAINDQTYVATCSIGNNTLDETIVLDGANKVISSSRTARIFGNDFTWEWIPLYDGVNTITVEGNCSIALEYREVRKVGEY